MGVDYYCGVDYIEYGVCLLRWYGGGVDVDSSLKKKRAAGKARCPFLFTGSVHLLEIVNNLSKAHKV